MSIDLSDYEKLANLAENTPLKIDAMIKRGIKLFLRQEAPAYEGVQKQLDKK